jgi:hypothetical protein
MAEPKSFPALQFCVDLLSVNDNDLVREARAELEKAREFVDELAPSILRVIYNEQWHQENRDYVLGLLRKFIVACRERS